MTDREIALELQRVERLLQRLTVCHRNPERFHEDRSELVRDIRQLRRRIEGND